MKNTAIRVFMSVVIAFGMTSVLFFSFDLVLHNYKPSSAMTVNIIYDYLLIEPYTHLPNVDFITIEERRHLLDVKRWLVTINIIEIVMVFCFLLCLFVLKISSRNFSLISILKHIGKWGVLFNVSIIFLFLMFFKFIFISAHTLFFNQGTWAFSDSALLPQLFPIAFFESFSYFTLGGAMSVFLLLFLVSYYLKEKS